MLLTAVILLFGFAALAGMVARVAQLSDETVQESRRPTFLEAEAATKGLAHAMERLELYLDPATAGDAVDYVAGVDDAVAHMAQIEAGRGFRFEATAATCDDSSGDAVVEVSFTLSRSDAYVAISVAHTLVGVPCTP